MRLRTALLALARPQLLMLGLALGLVAVLPAAARAQEPGALTPDELEVPAATEAGDIAAEDDPAEAGDVPLADGAVQSLQETLKDLGYFYGPADGRKGPRTRTAVRNFQRDQGLEVTGSLDEATLARLQSLATTTERKPDAEPADASADAPTDATAAPAATSSSGSPSRARRAGAALSTAGGAVKDGVSSGVGAVHTAGKATVDASQTTGKAIGTAGSATGSAAAKAGTTTASATTTAYKAVTNATVVAYDKTRRAIMGDKQSRDRSDEAIREAILRQFAGEPRIEPSEVDVRVARGNVTLALPEGARTDIPHAVRLAKLTPGVKSVTSLTTSVNESAPAGVSAPAVESAPGVPPPPPEPTATEPTTTSEPILQPQR